MSKWKKLCEVVGVSSKTSSAEDVLTTFIAKVEMGKAARDAAGRDFMENYANALRPKTAR